MSKATPDFDVLDELLAQVWEHGDDVALHQRINDLLDGDQRAQRRYLEQLLLHADLLDPSGPLCGIGLRHPKDDAEPDWITQLELQNEKLRQGQSDSIDKNPVTARQLFSLAGYVFGKALISKPAYKVYAAAATVILVVTLFLVFGTGDDTPINPLANQNPPTGTQNDPANPALEGVPTTRDSSVATLTAEYNAQWQTASGGVAPSVGNGLAPGRLLAITDGVVQITTGSGAVVTLQGPAAVRTHAEGRLELIRGKLVASCETPESTGFTVFTDTAEVTDIGTVFGVERHASGQTTTGVLSGHVALSYKANEEAPRLLKAGDVAGISADGLAMTITPDDMTQAFGAWGKLLRPVTVTGDAIFVDSMPNQLPEDEQLVRVYREPAGVLLQKDQVVSRTEPGLYRPTDPDEKSTLAAGIRVDSYYVHIDRPRRPTDGGVAKQFTITFDQPVVALIVHTQLVITTNGKFGNPGVTYPKAGGIGLLSKSGLKPDDPQVDSLQWSDDRKTLTVTLSVEDADQFRVLTLSPQAALADGLND